MKENLQPAPGSLSTQIFPPMPRNQPARDGKAQSHAFGLTFVVRQAEEIVKDFQMIFRQEFPARCRTR